MCGRFSLHHPSDEIHETFNIEHPIFLSAPRYNIAPTQQIAVVTPDYALIAMRWGLVPSWSRDGKPFINARAESVLEKPAFRAAAQQRRIIVPCSGFYEWRTDGKLKVPMHIRLRSGRLFGLAAIYEPAASPSLEPTVALLTVAANRLLSPFHDRMPVILDTTETGTWLEPSTGLPTELLRPFASEEMELFTVSNRVNGTRDDDPSLLAPVRYGLFG